MNAHQWVSTVKTSLEQLRDRDFSYPLGVNTVFDPQPSAIVEHCLRSFNLTPIRGLTDFYVECDGVSLPDIHTGYFIKHVRGLTCSRPESEPTRITGQFAGEVQTFGSSGNGSLFVVRRIEQDVICLPPGPLHDGLYDATRARATRIAPDFPVFLDALLADITAFVNNTPRHKYIV